MARRIRTYNWAATPLGPIEAWPQALRTAVEMVLASPLVSSLLCGPDRILIYNDAAARLFGSRHPGALGRPLPETFPEGWRTVAPLYERVFAGETVQITAQPLDTRGEDETVSDVFDAALIPLCDEQGRVAYTHMTGFEVGDRLRADAALRESEERQAFLLKLSDALRPLADAAEIQAMTTRLLGQHLGVDRSMYGDVEGEPGAETGIIRGQYVRPARGDDPPVLPFPERFTFRPFGARTMARRYRGELLVVADVTADPGFEPSERAAWTAAGVRAAIVTPLAKGGRLVAEFGVHCTAPRAWTDAEVSLVQDVAERTWAAAERARAEEGLRRSEAKYRNLFDTMGQGYCELELLRDAQGRAVDQRYLELNPAFERLFGIPVAEAKGRTASEVFPQLEAHWTEAFDRVAKTGRPERIEHQVASLDRWFEVFAYPRGGDRLSVLYEDVTERKRAELTRRASEEGQAFLLMLSDRLRREVDARAIAVTSLSLLAGHMRLDRAYVAQVDKGRDLAEIGPEYRRPDLARVEGVLTLSDFPEAFARVEATTLVLADTAADPTLSELDRQGFAALRIGALIVASARKGTRNPVWALLVASEEPRHWTAVEVALVEEVAERIWATTERAQAEAALRESEERLAAVFDVLPVGVGVVDAGGTLVLSNAGMRRFLPSGVIPSRDEVGRVRWRAWHPDGRPIEPQDFPGARALRGEQVLGNEMLCVDDSGQEIWTNVSAVPLRGADGTPTGAVAVVNDIDALKRNADAVRESEAKLRIVLDGIGEAFYALDRDWRFLFASRSALKLWGKQADDVLGRSFLACFPQAAGTEPYEAHQRVMQTGRAEHLEIISPVLRRWIEVDLAPTAGGGVSVALRDIDDRKKAEEALRESEERHRLILESARDYAIFTTDAQGRIQTWPPGAEAVYGWTADEALAQDMAITFTPEDREAGVPEKERAEARDAGQAPNVRWHIRKDGRRVFIEGSTRPLRNGGPEPHAFLKVGQDVTERREWEETQKVLLAELQHRTRNLLAVVRSVADRTLASSSSLDAFQDRFRHRIEALARVNSLLSRLEESTRISFDELLRAELAGHGVVDGEGHGSPVTLEGPKGVRLRSATVQTFALGLHELATNAVKHGALSRPEGRLRVRWCLVDGEDRDQRLRVEWHESGVPVPPETRGQPYRRGSGRELIERSLPYQLGAETSYELTPDGVRCTITLPISTTHWEAPHA